MSDAALAEIAIEMALALGAALVGGIAAIRLRLPVYLGYLVAGIVLGLLSTTQDEGIDTIGAVADFSAAALLFILALQFPLRRLVDRPAVAILASGQFLVVAAGVAWFFAAIGTESRAAIVLGCALAAPSTLFAAAILEGRLGGATRDILVASSLAQGGIALVVVGLAPAMTSASGPFEWTRALPILLLPAGIVVGRFVLRHALARIEDPQDELAQLTVVAVVLVAVAAPAVLGGLPLAFAGLAAGWLVGSHGRARAAVRRLADVREVFVAFFLVGLGRLFDPGVLMREGLVILAFAGLSLGLRLAAVAAVARSSGLRGGEAIVAAAALLPLGEFAFAVGQEGLVRGVLQPADHGLIVGITVSSMAVASAALPAVARDRTRIDVAPLRTNG